MRPQTRSSRWTVPSTVKEIMIAGGVADARIGTDGYGEEKPIAPNETEEGRAKNRRTELIVAKR